MLANQINQGDHVAFFFKTKEEQLGTVIPFIAIGLEKNEQCLYIADANTPAEIRQQLQAYGVDVDAAKKSGALSIVTKHETYLRHGSFEPHKMIIDLCSAVDDSVDDSLRVLTVCVPRASFPGRWICLLLSLNW
jgi:chemotaxis family two-component system sensor kinase Cph1